LTDFIVRADGGPHQPGHLLLFRIIFGIGVLV